MGEIGVLFARDRVHRDPRDQPPSRSQHGEHHGRLVTSCWSTLAELAAIPSPLVARVIKTIRWDPTLCRIVKEKTCQPGVLTCESCTRKTSGLETLFSALRQLLHRDRDRAPPRARRETEKDPPRVGRSSQGLTDRSSRSLVSVRMKNRRRSRAIHSGAADHAGAPPRAGRA